MVNQTTIESDLVYHYVSTSITVNQINEETIVCVFLKQQSVFVGTGMQAGEAKA